jgi:phosphotransferase system  glucose/maltose/N-acetylglucosamine-specific IIC component
MMKLTEAFQEIMGILNALIGVLNAVHTNVWAILLVMMAVGLYRDGKDAAALAITTGAFTMLQAGRSAPGERQ